MLDSSEHLLNPIKNSFKFQKLYLRRLDVYKVSVVQVNGLNLVNQFDTFHDTAKESVLDPQDNLFSHLV